MFLRMLVHLSPCNPGIQSPGVHVHVYTVQLDLFFHHCMTTKIFFLILPRLKCRDEQLLHLNNKNQNLDEEVMSLRMQLRREEEKCKRLVDFNKQIAEDRDQFKDR